VRNRRDPTRSIERTTVPGRHVCCARGSRRFSSKAKLNGTTNGHVPSTGASSTAEHNKRIRTVRNNNREKCRVFNRSVKFVFTKRLPGRNVPETISQEDQI